MLTAVLPTTGPRLGEMEDTEKYLKTLKDVTIVSLLKDIASSVSKMPEPAGFKEAAGEIHIIVVESTSVPGNDKELKNLHNTCPLNSVFPSEGKPYPKIVIMIPPSVGPRLGEMDKILGSGMNKKLIPMLA
jgi:hypothetical protein